MKNKLLRLAELIQEGFPEDLVEAFKSNINFSLDERLDLVGQAITYHQKRSAELWQQAGKKRTPEERHASARAELAAFLLAYLTGDAKEHTESGVEALRTLGRESEIDLVKRLSRR